MRSRVVGLSPAAGPLRDFHVDAGADRERSPPDRDAVGDDARDGLAGIEDLGLPALPRPHAGVRDLATPLGIEDRSIGHGLARLAGAKLRRRTAVADETHDPGPLEPAEIELRVPSKLRV